MGPSSRKLYLRFSIESGISVGPVFALSCLISPFILPFSPAFQGWLIDAGRRGWTKRKENISLVDLLDPKWLISIRYIIKQTSGLMKGDKLSGVITNDKKG